ncbi:Vba1p [Nakaseomyces bracarensis]|uniref:Vba1p n=1 Tax=Nakaseomyces bracarensis TaxID=273131 RepID=UPI003871A1A5
METLDETTGLLEETPEVDSLEVQYHNHNMSLPKVPIVLSLWLGSFLSSLDGTIVANIMNKVAEEFHESDKKQWIATSYLLTNTAFQPLYGKLSDLTGRKFAVLTAHFFFGLGCLLTCFANNVTQFAIARAICGVGGGGINAMSSITVSDICTQRERGIYQGYANIVFGMGQILGAPIGGLFIDTIGWRILFGLQVPTIMVCSLLVQKNVNIKLSHLLPYEERFKLKNLARIDIFGSTTLVFTISGVLFLCSTSLNKTLLSVFTLLSFIAFILIELYHSKERIMPFELMRGSFGLASLATVISSFIIFGDIFRSPIYLQLIQNISVMNTGFFLLFPSISVAVGSLVTGYILRHTKLNLSQCAYWIVAAGMCIQLVGLCVAYTLINNLEPSMPFSYNAFLLISKDFRLSSTSYWWVFYYVIALILVSFGYACLLVATLVNIVFTIPKSQQGSVTGIFYLWRSIGNVLGESITLVFYEKGLAKLLWKFMFKQPHDDYHFTKKDYQKLLKDSSYLKSGHFPTDILFELLKVYKDAFSLSYLPNFVLAISGVVCCIVLLRISYRK